jgi:hypothetical protein
MTHYENKASKFKYSRFQPPLYTTIFALQDNGISARKMGPRFLQTGSWPGSRKGDFENTSKTETRTGPNVVMQPSGKTTL